MNNDEDENEIEIIPAEDLSAITGTTDSKIRNGVLTSKTLRFKMAHEKPKTYEAFTTIFSFGGLHILLGAPDRESLAEFLKESRLSVPAWSEDNFQHCHIGAANARDLRAFHAAQAEWSQATFGTDAERGPLGPLKHLEKEAREAQKDPKDIMEFVDCLFLTFDASRRAGFTYEQLLVAAWKKLEMNKARTWPKGKPDEAVEHDRSEAA